MRMMNPIEDGRPRLRGRRQLEAGRFVGVVLLAWVGAGCEPTENDYIAEGRRDFDGTTYCCNHECTTGAGASCAVLKDARIVKSTVVTTQGPPGKLREVVLDFDGPRGKGHCNFYYWNSGPRIQLNINVMAKCPASSP